MAYYYKRLRELREDNNKTQQQIADLLKVGLTSYRRWETGERTIPTNYLIDLSKYYNVSTDYILELSDEERKKWISKTIQNDIHHNKNVKVINKQ